MKITQITSENTVSEAPGGSALGNIARKVGAKVAGAVGAKGTAAGMTGKAQANDRSKEIFVQYKQYMGQVGGNAKAPTVDQVQDFMQKQGLSTTHLKGLTGQMTPKQVDDVLQKTAQDTFKGDLGKSQAGSEPATLGQKYSGGSDAPAGGTDQADPTGQKPAPAKAGGGAPGGKGIPADIQKAVDSLNPQQKKELAQLL